MHGTEHNLPCSHVTDERLAAGGGPVLVTDADCVHDPLAMGVRKRVLAEPELDPLGEARAELKGALLQDPLHAPMVRMALASTAQAAAILSIAEDVRKLRETMREELTHVVLEGLGDDSHLDRVAAAVRGLDATLGNA